MKAITGWNYAPHTKHHEAYKALSPYVCRLAPTSDGFEFEWFDKGSDGAHKVIINKRGEGSSAIEYKLTDRDFTVTGLTEGETYEFTVYRDDMSASSATRLVRIGAARGKIINYIHPEDDYCRYSGVCPSSPCIISLPSGKLLACFDILYGTTDTKITPIYESFDHGESWHYLTELYPCHWGRLFYHRNRLYCIGVTASQLVLGYSLDEGKTWSKPSAIMDGAPRDYSMHKSSTPVIEHNGRVYVAVEYGSWAMFKYYHMMLSAPADSDLMDSSNWVFTEPGLVEIENLGMDVEKATGCEGNAVALPDGTVADILRADPPMDIDYGIYNFALIMKSDPKDPEAKLKFDKRVYLPVGYHNKFEIRKTPDGEGYVAVGNEITEDHRLRSLLTLSVSRDFENWRGVATVVDARGDEPEDLPKSEKKIAYSDAGMDFDGDDVVVVTRTAANGAMSFHNNNMVCFFKVKNYKQYFTK